MCLACGFYKGRMVVDMAAKNKSREERLKAKHEAINSQQPEAESAPAEVEEVKEIKEVAESKETTK